MTAVTNDAEQVTDAHFDHFRVQRSSGRTRRRLGLGRADGVPTATGSYLNHATVKVDATDLGSGVDTVEYASAPARSALHAPVKSRAPAGALSGDRRGRQHVADRHDHVTIAALPACDPVPPEPGFRRSTTARSRA